MFLHWASPKLSNCEKTIFLGHSRIQIRRYLLLKWYIINIPWAQITIRAWLLRPHESIESQQRRTHLDCESCPKQFYEKETLRLKNRQLCRLRGCISKVSGEVFTFRSSVTVQKGLGLHRWNGKLYVELHVEAKFSVFCCFFSISFAARTGSQPLEAITAGPHHLTRPVDFPCGKKPEYPEKTHDFQQSVDLYTFHTRTGFESSWEVLTENLTRDHGGEKLESGWTTLWPKFRCLSWHLTLPEQADQDGNEDRVIDTPSNVFTLVVSWWSIPNAQTQPYAPDKKQDLSYTIKHFKLFTTNVWMLNRG